ncbi:MAG: LytTR family transcriptional regulator [Oscillospiraceae bacterium]|nr:LytTR family transcriptional regulator [Oscillospiraceae bacterium]
MKCTVIIDGEREQEVVIYAHERTELINKIEALASEEQPELVGFSDREAVIIAVDEVFCFATEDNRVFALCENERLRLKERLYKIEEDLPADFVRINQSCIANIKKIRRFDASISGTLRVVFKNGHIDYVSRRQLKQVKERLGL